MTPWDETGLKLPKFLISWKLVTPSLYLNLHPRLDHSRLQLIILKQLRSGHWRVASSILTFWVTSSCRVLILIPSSSQLGAAKCTTPFSLSIIANGTRQYLAPRWFKTFVCGLKHYTMVIARNFDETRDIHSTV